MSLFRRRSTASTEGATPADVAPAAGCAHLQAAGPGPDEVPDPRCEDCTALGEDVWAHLRQCLTCGHVACCDSSPHRHATAHHHGSGHPVMRSAEPGESWRWCYEDSLLG